MNNVVSFCGSIHVDIILSVFFVHHSFSVFCTSFFQCFFVHHSFNVFCTSFFQCFFVHHSFNVFCTSFFQCFCTSFFQCFFVHHSFNVFVHSSTGIHPICANSQSSSHLFSFTIFIPFFIFISIFRMHLPLQNPFYFAHYLDKLIYSTKIF